MFQIIFYRSKQETSTVKGFALELTVAVLKLVLTQSYIQRQQTL